MRVLGLSKGSHRVSQAFCRRFWSWDLGFFFLWVLSDLRGTPGIQKGLQKEGSGFWALLRCALRSRIQLRGLESGGFRGLRT